MTNPNPEPAPLPADQALAYEAYVQEILKARRGDASRDKQTLYYLFETQGGSTLMTVLVGGLFAALINGCIQQSITDRQAEQNRATAAQSTRLEILKGNLKDRETSNREMMELVGHMVSRTQDLAVTYGPGFREPDGDGENKKKRRDKLREQIAKVRQAFNDAHVAWNQKREATGYMVVLYHGGDAKVAAAWEKLAGAVGDYVDWTSETLADRPGEFSKYKEKEAAIRARMRELAEVLRQVPVADIVETRNVGHGARQ